MAEAQHSQRRAFEHAETIQYPGVVPTDLVLLDLDETLLSTTTLAEARHSKQRVELSGLQSYAELRLHDGIVDVLDKLSDVTRVGLVSNSGRWYVDQLLHSFLPDFKWATKVTYDDVLHLKPNPEPLLLALQQTGVAPDRTLYVGDSGVDHEASMSAGIDFVGAGWADSPTYPIATLSVRSPRDLLTLVNWPRT